MGADWPSGRTCSSLDAGGVALCVVVGSNPVSVKYMDQHDDPCKSYFFHRHRKMRQVQSLLSCEMAGMVTHGYSKGL